MKFLITKTAVIIVALRKESVDRNISKRLPSSRGIQSLSARRAWIEIADADIIQQLLSCRSPQGERG